jgi:hypothetical protein
MNEVSASANSQRFTAWGFALATAVAVVAINAAIEFLVGFDVSSVVVAVVVPLGVIAVAAAGLSGFLLGVKRSWMMPDTVDLVFLMVLAFATALAIHGYQYILATADLAAAQKPSFRSFVSDQITETLVEFHTRFDKSDTPPVKAGGLGILTAIATVGALPAVAKVIHSTGVSWAINRPDPPSA